MSEAMVIKGGVITSSPLPLMSHRLKRSQHSSDLIVNVLILKDKNQASITWHHALLDRLSAHLMHNEDERFS